MKLKVLLPYQVFADKAGVSRLVAETRDGAFGLWPHRLDCVAALVPGILTCESGAEGEVIIAIDQGVLIKVGDAVTVSVRRAFAGNDLARLREAVESEFLQLDAQARSARAASRKLESGFLSRFASYQHA